MTGYRFFNKLLVGFVIGDLEYFAITDFTKSETFKINLIPNLGIANSANTVSCELLEHKITKTNLISKAKCGTLANNAGKRTRNVVSILIGLAFAIVELIKTHKALEMATARELYDKLFDKLNQIEQDFLQTPDDISIIPLRAQTTILLTSFINFANQIFKGAILSTTHPYNLIKREVELFTVLAANKDLFIETCEQLSNIC